MVRNRRDRRDLTESWHDVDADYEFDDNDDEEQNAEPDQDEDRTRRRSLRTSRFDFATTTTAAADQPPPRAGSRNRPGARSSLEPPALVMPSSPNAGATDAGKSSRAKTPRLRVNERSLTSDAGAFDVDRARPRAHTPHFRMNARSMTSDAGRFGAGQAAVRRREGEEGEDSSRDRYSSSAHRDQLWSKIVQPVVGYVGDIMGIALNNAKPLLGYLVLAYLIGALLVFGSNFLNNTINHALSPICRIPGVTFFFNPPFCPVRDAPEVEGVAEFDKLIQAQSAFDDVLAASSEGATLPMDMKRSEASIRDLKHVVQYSTLPSRNELVFEFGGFVETARQASQDLSRFNSRIGRAVDHILSTNRWTLNVIDGVASSQANRGSISTFLSNQLNIFAPFQPVSLSSDILLDQYLRHTSAVEDQILTLISEAQALLAILDNLDGRLDVIAEIATRDGLKTEASRDELLAYLWTKLGGNRSSVKRFDHQLDLLKQVGAYKRIAWAHVTATIVKLQAIRDNLEDLRERVAMPETVGTDKVPLEVHIQAINLGVERLEKQRENARAIERDAYGRIVGGADAGEHHFIGEKEL